METDKVIVIEKTEYRSEDIISCNGVARCLRNHGYRGGVVIVEDYDQNRREMKKTDRVMTVESGRHRAYRTYKTEGISPAITTPTGGGLIPKIIKMKEDPKIVSYSRDKKGKIKNYHTKEVANTIHCSTGTRSNTAQYVLEPKPIVEMNKFRATTERPSLLATTNGSASRGRPKGGQGEYGVKFETKMDGTSNALTRATRLNLVAELQTEFAESVGSTLTSARPNNVYGDTFPYRIRSLIPRECFRLMDVDDEDYDKIKNYVKGHRKNGKPMYISESQQYKLAGNSIVVACMEHIFEQLFFPSGRVTEPRQLDIFDII